MQGNDVIGYGISNEVMPTSLSEVVEERSLEAYLAMKSKLGILRRYSELGLAGQEFIALGGMAESRG